MGTTLNIYMPTQFKNITTACCMQSIFDEPCSMELNCFLLFFVTMNKILNVYSYTIAKHKQRLVKLRSCPIKL